MYPDLSKVTAQRTGTPSRRPAWSTQLNSFTLRFDDWLDPDTVDIAAEVYAWDDSKSTGTQLFARG